MARLTIPDEQTFAEFTVVTSTSAFPITFSLFAKADLTVKVDDVTLDQSAFTFTGTVLQGGGYDGGTVTLNAAVDDVTVRIERNVTPARTSNFAPSANTPVGNIDQAFNRLTATQQDLKRRFDSVFDDITSDVLEDLLAELPTILEGLDLRRPFGGLWLYDYARNDSGVIDGVGAMFRRAKAAGLAADKPVYMLPALHAIDGTPDGANGLLEQTSAGTPWFICATGAATIAPAASTNRAIVALSGGGSWRTDNIIYDATNVTSNFAFKNENGGDFKSEWVKFVGKGMRWVGDVGRIEIDRGIATDVEGHGFSSGSATGEAFGYNDGGWINSIVGTNVTKSDFNWAATRSRQPLIVGTIVGRWPKFETDGTVYPTKYAACRIGNGSANIYVRTVLGEGKYRAARLTDTDSCTIDTVIGVNCLGPTVLTNSKDQVARASSIGRIISINACRNFGRTDIVDEDGEGVQNEASVAVALAEGENWAVGGVSGVADEYLLGLGSCLAVAGSATLTNRDHVLRGQDFNCFDDVKVGDLVFDEIEQTFGRVSAISAKTYWTDAKETTSQGAASGADHATQTITLDAISPRTDATGVGTITVSLNGTTVTGSGTAFASTDIGRNLHNLAGDYVGRVIAVPDASTLTLATGGAKVGVPGAGYLLSARYRYRTPDAWFFTPGTGNATCTTGGATVTVATAQLRVGDLVFNNSRQYVGEVLTIDDANTLTLTANAARDVPGAAWQFGRPKKVLRGVEISNTAVATNINRDNCYIRGAVTQFYLDEPEGVRPTAQGTINKTRLARLDATKRRGEVWDVSDMVPPGPVRSNGTVWVKLNETGLRTVSTTTDFTHTYLDSAPTTRLTGVLAADRTITLSETGLPDGASYTFNHIGATTYSWLIKSAGGTTILTLRPGQIGTVVYDGSGTPTWRRAGIAFGAATAPLITTGTGAPSSLELGDAYLRSSGTSPDEVLYVGEPSGARPWVSGGRRITAADMAALTPSQHNGQCFIVTDLGLKPVEFYCNGSAFVPISRAEVAWANRAALAAVNGLDVWVTDVGLPNGSLWRANGTRLVRTGRLVLYSAAATAGISTAITGVIGETVAPGFTSPSIPAGVLDAGDTVVVSAGWIYSGTAGTKNPIVRFSTTDAIAGTAICNVSQTATTVRGTVRAEHYMVSTSAQQLLTSISLSGNMGVSTAAASSGSLSITGIIYIVFTNQCAGAADTATLGAARVEIM